MRITGLILGSIVLIAFSSCAKTRTKTRTCTCKDSSGKMVSQSTTKTTDQAAANKFEDDCRNSNNATTFCEYK